MTRRPAKRRVDVKHSNISARTHRRSKKTCLNSLSNSNLIAMPIGMCMLPQAGVGPASFLLELVEKRKYRPEAAFYLQPVAVQVAVMHFSHVESILNRMWYQSHNSMPRRASSIGVAGNCIRTPTSASYCRSARSPALH